MYKVIFYFILVVLVGCSSYSQENTPTLPGINLARTSLASISATSQQAEYHYGIKRAFDNGEHWHNGLNYTYWICGAGDQNPTVNVFFKTPVQISSIVVESGPTFSTKFITKDNKEQHCSPVNHILKLKKPVPDIISVHLTFKRGKRGVRVQEVRILGSVQGKTSYNIQVPEIAQKKSNSTEK